MLPWLYLGLCVLMGVGLVGGVFIGMPFLLEWLLEPPCPPCPGEDDRYGRPRCRCR